MKDILKRGVADTVSQLGGRSGIIVLVLSILGGWALHGVMFGSIAATEQWPAAASGLATYAVMATIFLTYNLAAARFRLTVDQLRVSEAVVLRETAKSSQLEAELADLRSMKPRLQMSVQCIISGGQCDQFGSLTAIVPIVRISNVGHGAPSATDGWAMALEMDGHDPIPLPLNHVFGSATFSHTEGQAVTWLEKDFIYRKTATPVQPGAIVEGPLFSIVDPGVLERVTTAKGNLVVSCTDVTGQRIEARGSFGAEDGGLRFMPHTEATYGDPDDDEANAA